MVKSRKKRSKKKTVNGFFSNLKTRYKLRKTKKERERMLKLAQNAFNREKSAREIMTILKEISAQNETSALTKKEIMTILKEKSAQNKKSTKEEIMTILKKKSALTKEEIMTILKEIFAQNEKSALTKNEIMTILKEKYAQNETSAQTKKENRNVLKEKARKAFRISREKEDKYRNSKNNFFINLTRNTRNRKHTKKISDMIKILGKDKATRILYSKWNNYKSKRKERFPEQNAHMMNQNWRNSVGNINITKKILIPEYRNRMRNRMRRLNPYLN
jgi:hypothetical protein